MIFPCYTIFSCPNLLHKVLVGIRDDSDFSSYVLLALHIHSLGICAKDETERTSFSRHSKADTLFLPTTEIRCSELLLSQTLLSVLVLI